MRSKIYLSIPFDQELMALVRQVPGAYWEPKAKLWVTRNDSGTQKAIEELGLMSRVVEIEPEQESLSKTSSIQKSAYDPAKDGTVRFARSKTRTELPQTLAQEITALEQMLMREGAAHQTIKSYRSVVAKLGQWWGKPLSGAKRKDLLTYLTHCIEERNYSRSTMNQLVNGIRAYYERVLGWPKDELRLPRPRRQRTLPNVCSEEEVLGMLKSIKNLKHQTILMVIYALGLRKGEAQKLLVKHVDLVRDVLTVKQAKGNKDRALIIQGALHKQLSNYIKVYQPKHWFFEGQTGGQYSATSIQAVFNKAKSANNLPDQLTVHGLRHSYATHMVERGTPLHVVKELLGHQSIQTTQIYLHTSSKKFKDLYDPLSRL